MESVPDMDDLLNEIEETIVTPSFSKPLDLPPIVEVQKIDVEIKEPGYSSLNKENVPIDCFEDVKEVINDAKPIEKINNEVLVEERDNNFEGKEQLNGLPEDSRLNDNLNSYEDTLRYLDSFPESTSEEDYSEEPVEEIVQRFDGEDSEDIPSEVLDALNNLTTDVVEGEEMKILEELSHSDDPENSEDEEPEQEPTLNEVIGNVAEIIADNLLDDISDDIQHEVVRHFNVFSFTEPNEDTEVNKMNHLSESEHDEDPAHMESDNVPILDCSADYDDNVVKTFQSAITTEELAMISPEIINVIEDEEVPSEPVASSSTCDSICDETIADSVREDEPDEPCTSEVRSESIATFHDLGQESDSNRLTESELMLGKTKPYWIPDSDCSSCMLCDLKFSLLLRRHHCRACGRVLCAACCSEKAMLQYMSGDSKQAPARVCTPCFSMLAKIEEYEKRATTEERNADETVRVKGVLKTRASSSSETTADSKTSEVADPSQRRSVMFRDGTKPGTTSQEGGAEEKSTVVKPRKKSRKRPSVQRRIIQFKLEDQLQSLLPDNAANELYILGCSGDIECINLEKAGELLKESCYIRVFLKKNLMAHIRITEVEGMNVWAVVSSGFSIIGQNEVVFCWKREEDDFKLPVSVLDRISQVFIAACELHSDGVQCVEERFPGLHSSSEFVSPLTRHILFFEPTTQDLCFLSPVSVGVRVACFIRDDELPWVLACPNRVLLRLGLKQSSYPIPIVNIPDRDSVYTSETSRTALKVFTDFRNWSYRMKRMVGSTVSLHIGGNNTVVKVPRKSKAVINSIISWNRSILAWRCDINTKADSHLVCDESEDGFYNTQVLARGNSREITGASFVIFNGSLKSNGQLQLSVIEDGIAIMMQPEKFSAFQENLTSGEFNDFTIEDPSGGKFFFVWVDSDDNTTDFSPKSTVSNKYIGDFYQYGLSLERALTSVLHATSDGKYGVILSQVLNCKEGRLEPDEEPRFFSVAEVIARECSYHLDAFIPLVLQMDIKSISINVMATAELVEYDVAQWSGLESEHSKYKENIYQLIPTLYSIIEHFRAGFHVEITLGLIMLNFSSTSQKSEEA